MNQDICILIYRSKWNSVNWINNDAIWNKYVFYIKEKFSLNIILYSLNDPGIDAIPENEVNDRRFHYLLIKWRLHVMNDKQTNKWEQTEK